MALERLPPPGTPDRLRRAIWMLVSALLYRTSPSVMRGWRRFLLRAFGAEISPTANPHQAARVFAPWRLVMESNSQLGKDADCYNVAPIFLRRGCKVGERVYLCSGSHDLEGADFALTGAAIEIGEDVLLAVGAFVGPGVTMASGSAAAPRAVVTRDVATGQIVAGDPARSIGSRTLPTQL